MVLGSVFLLGADAKPRTAWIEADGSYRFDDVPVGEAKLAIHSPQPTKQGKLRKSLAKEELAPRELPAVDRTKWLAIPAEHSDVDHSGLRITINRGPNTYHLDMK